MNGLTNCYLLLSLATACVPRDGMDGIDGIDGAWGETGVPGADGSDGAQGIPGEDGEDGANEGDPPIMSEIAVEACSSTSVRARWKTDVLADTAVDYERETNPGIVYTCLNTTPSLSHQSDGLRTCYDLGHPTGNYSTLRSGEKALVTVRSRGANGHMAEVATSVETPNAYCLCAPEVDCSEQCPGALPGLDLEQLVPAETGDAYITSQYQDGKLVLRRLWAPWGVIMLEDTMICDIASAPPSGFKSSVVLLDRRDPDNKKVVQFWNTSLLIRTSAGRVVKTAYETYSYINDKGIGLAPIYPNPDGEYP